MQRLKSQNSIFHSLISKLKFDRDEKKALVKKVSSGRCTSSKDLTANEMKQAIEMLTGNYDSRIARMQAKARAIANDLGILKTVDGKVDYSAMNSFILRTFKQPNMFKLDHDQLRDLITALERWRDNKTKRMVNNCLNAI